MRLVRDIRDISFSLGIWLIILGVCLLSVQLYELALYGKWTFISLADAVQWLELPFVVFPADASLGSKILHLTPFPLLCMACGSAMLWQRKN